MFVVMGANGPDGLIIIISVVVAVVVVPPNGPGVYILTVTGPSVVAVACSVVVLGTENSQSLPAMLSLKELLPLITLLSEIEL